MKTLFVLLLFVFFGTNTPKGFIPPGTKPINDTLFIDESVVSNEDWAEYIFYRKHSHQLFFLPADTAFQVNDKPVILNSYVALSDYIAFRNEAINSRLCSYTKEDACQSSFYKKYAHKNVGVKYDWATTDEVQIAIQKKKVQPFETLEITKDKAAAVNKNFTFRCSTKVIAIRCKIE